MFSSSKSSSSTLLIPPPHHFSVSSSDGYAAEQRKCSTTSVGGSNLNFICWIPKLKKGKIKKIQNNNTKNKEGNGGLMGKQIADSERMERRQRKKKFGSEFTRIGLIVLFIKKIHFVLILTVKVLKHHVSNIYKLNRKNWSIRKWRWSRFEKNMGLEWELFNNMHPNNKCND
jgi:hypothetical protein